MASDKRRAAARAWYAKNREKVREEQRTAYAVRKDDPAFKAKRKAERDIRRAEHNAYCREWRRLHPNEVTANNAKLGSPSGALSPQDVAEARAMSDGICAYCLQHRVLELEHCTPKSRGGLNEPSNVVMACKPCNSGKRDKTVLEYLCRSA